MRAVSNKQTAAQPASIEFWPLFEEGNSEPIPCHLFEVSHSTVGIVTSSTLQPGSRISMQRPNCPPLSFEVAMQYGDSQEQGSQRYRLHPVASLNVVDCENLVYDETRTKLTKSSFLKPLQKTRFALNPSITSSCRTFGSLMSYKFDISNASKSGLYLRPRMGSDAPFQVSTLLEITLVIPDHKPIELVGRTVRFEYDLSLGKKCYGIAVSENASPGYEDYSALIELYDTALLKAA